MPNDNALANIEKVNDLANRIAEFLPQSRALPKDTRLTIAQIAVAHGLDPFLGDIWAIPERDKSGGEWRTTGYRIMIGISAWRRAAHDTGEYWGRRFEKVTDEERRWLGAGQNDLAIKCVVMRRKTGQQPVEFDGFGIFRADERSKMNPLQCVRLRAERDALKGAFPIGFGNGTTIKIGVADDSGNEINGDIEHGPKWNVITTDPVEPPIEQVSETTEPAEVGNTEPAQWPHDYDQFCAWMKANGYSGSTSKKVFGTDVRTWLNQNPIESYETAAMNVKAVMNESD